MQKDGTTIVNTVHLILNVKYSFLFLKIVSLKLLIVGQKWSEKWTHMVERKKGREKERKEQRETEKWEREKDSKKEKQRY